MPLGGGEGLVILMEQMASVYIYNELRHARLYLNGKAAFNLSKCLSMSSSDNKMSGQSAYIVKKRNLIHTLAMSFTNAESNIPLLTVDKVRQSFIKAFSTEINH